MPDTKKVLIVEDDKFLANAYRVKFSKEGFEPEIAHDGTEALEILGRFTPAVILLDLVMPIKDGFATLADLQTNDQWKNIPVIIASNLGQKEDIDKGMAAGAVDFIVKSNMALDDIVKKVDSVISAS